MSIPAYRAVWEMNQTERFHGSVLAVWLCLAEHANAGGYCFPGIPRMGRMCGIDDRSVQRALRSLEDAGIVRVKASRGKVSAYYVPVVTDDGEVE